MKTIKQQNMDLDLRRFGHNLYTEALNNGSGEGGGSVDINTILDNISIKDDLLTKVQAIDYTNQDEDGILTDLTFDDVFNDYNDSIKSLLYREERPAIPRIVFPSSCLLDCISAGTISLTMRGYTLYISSEDSDIKIFAYKESGGGGPI